MGIEQVTVFGGTGFVGSRIVKLLSSHAKSIRVAIRHPKTKLVASPVTESGTVAHVYADIVDEASVAKAIEGSQAVINVVSLFVERGDITFEAVHVQGAQNVAQQAKQLGVKSLVHFSGLGADTNSRSSYVRARADGETTVQQTFPNATILRPSVIFGPEDAFFNTLSNITRFTPVLPLFGDGSTLLQPVFVDDVAAAAVNALITPQAQGKTYQLGGPKVYSYKTLVKLLFEHLGRNRLLMPMPFVIWQIEAAVLNLLPNPPITRDQVILMQHDNVVSDSGLTLTDLGIEPTTVESRLADCLADPQSK